MLYFLLIIGVILPAFLSLNLQKSAHLESELSAHLRSELADTLKGARELAIYQASTQQIAKCDSTSERYNQQLFKQHKALANSNGINLLVVQLTMLASVIIIAPLVFDGAMKNVELAMMSLFVLASFETVLNLPNAFIQLPSVLGAAKRIFELEDKLTHNTTNTKEAHQPTLMNNNQALGLTLNNVSYCYNGNQYALEDISLTINAAEKVALVGPSGSGKTTLVNLLTGLWPMQTGSASLTNKQQTIDLNSLTSQQRFALLSIVAQQHHIFDGTLRENLLYAAPEADDETLIKACQHAQLGDWLENLKHGLDTRFGTAGRKLSQGQSRRIALAQALLRNSALVVLDEPTESLDNQTKHAVINTLMQVMKNKTVLTITHDPALLSTMDKVIWLEDGKLRAAGKHQTLVAEHTDYLSLITRF